ncbi:MAG: RnfABCDGE type electron transport complex subunit D [Mycoplasmatales bacterium]
MKIKLAKDAFSQIEKYNDPEDAIRYIRNALIFLAVCSVGFNTYMNVAFGIKTLAIIVVAIIVAWQSELIFFRVFRKVDHKTALEMCHTSYPIITGLVFALLLPVGTSLFATSVATVFGVFIVRNAFGGYSFNVFNAAVGARIFAQAAWPDQMHAKLTSSVLFDKTLLYFFPAQTQAIASAGGTNFVADTVSGASDVASEAGDVTNTILNAAGDPLQIVFSQSNLAIQEMLTNAGVSDSPMQILDLFNSQSLYMLGAVPFFVLIPIIAYLVYRRVLPITIPVTIIAFISVILLTLATFGNYPYINIIFYLLSVTNLFIIFFTACEPFTAPKKKMGLVIYGIIIAFAGLYINFLAATTLGLLYAVLFANMLTPLINIKSADEIRKPQILKIGLMIVIAVGFALFINFMDTEKAAETAFYFIGGIHG